MFDDKPPKADNGYDRGFEDALIMMEKMADEVMNFGPCHDTVKVRNVVHAMTAHIRDAKG